jgi:hypothetical protein
MVYGLYCDACDEPLLVDSNVRYVTKVEVYAAYDPLEITEEDLKSANRDTWEQLMAELKDADAGELESQIHVAFRYDLCPKCRKRYLRDPLGPARPAGEEADTPG